MEHREHASLGQRAIGSISYLIDPIAVALPSSRVLANVMFFEVYQDLAGEG